MQANCVKWFRLAHRSLALNLFCTPNAGRRTAWEAKQLKEEGMVAGVSDLVLLVPNSRYHGLCIECKTETECWTKGTRTVTRTYQRPEQKEWQAAVEAQGYRYVVVRSVDEFIEIIEDYLKCE